MGNGIRAVAAVAVGALYGSVALAHTGGGPHSHPGHGFIEGVGHWLAGFGHWLWGWPLLPAVLVAVAGVILARRRRRHGETPSGR